MRIRKRTRKPFGPPENARAGADAIIGAAVKLYDRRDGQGADWRAVNEALFLAAFAVLDRLSDGERKSIARDVHARAYDRMVGNEIEQSIHGGEKSNMPYNHDRAPDYRPR